MKIELALSYCSLPPLSLAGFCLTDLASWVGQASIVSAFNYNQRLFTKNASPSPFLPLIPQLTIYQFATSSPPQTQYTSPMLISFQYWQMKIIKFLVGAAGIYSSYLISSLLLQKIFTEQYPLKGKTTTKHYFQHSDLVQLMSSIFCLLYAAIALRVKGEPKSPLPMKEVLVLGVLYFVNVSALNYCLYYIPYPMRVVGDKLGYLTAVIVGVFFSRIGNNSRYRLGKEKIVIALMITVGTLMFSYFYKITKKTETLYDPNQMWIGFLLLGVSVIAEALFSDSQAFNKVTYKPSMNHMLFAVNIIGVMCSGGMLLARGELSNSINFCLTHKSIGLDLLIYAGLSVLGQVSIYFIILNFKQHMFPLISTTRKVFTVLLSIYIYQHPTNIWMWMALVLVFGGLIYELADELYYDLTGEKQLKVRKGE